MVVVVAVPPCLTSIEVVPYPTAPVPPNPGPSTPKPAPWLVVVVVVVTWVVPRVPKLTVEPATGGRTLVPISIAWFTDVVIWPSAKWTPVSTTPKLVVPKSIVFLMVEPVSTTPNCWVPKSIAPWTLVPKSIALWTVVVWNPSVATPDPCLIEALKTDFLTISGFTELLTTSLMTEVLTISLCTCPLISWVSRVSFL